MPSLIEGYNYDIFISYRQKDNKHDGWVTEFVDNLQGELESTFKKEISVYFDVNPHDGLLETHDVDESLKDKLKCLILIPIISRTYCDLEAFAWEHEFKTFIKQASKDEFGLKVKLPNGNVASRVLPVVIYDLDKQDIKLCESALGGVLRGVEFIYKSAGVNRPLTPTDNPDKNLNNTFYRDQVNKVANTIKDVLNSMRGKGLSDEVTTETSSEDKGISTEKPVKKPRKTPKVSLLYRLKNFARLNLKAWRIIALVLFIGYFGIYWLGLRKPSSFGIQEIRYDISINSQLERTGRKSLTISPDGKYLVYVMNGELNLKQLNSDSPSEPISGTAGSRSPFFSPDGTWIGFENFSEGMIMKVPLTGGNPVTICDLEGTLNQANWHENGIIYAVGSSIYRVPDSGGEPELLNPLSQSWNNFAIWNLQLLPDKKTLLFNQQSGDGGWSIMTWQLGSKKNPVVLIERGIDGRYLNSDHLVYSLNNRLYICKFNSKNNRIISEPQIIATNPVYKYASSIGYGASQFDFSYNGILVYYEQQGTGQRHLVWADESGAVEPITREAKQYGYTAISSDAQYIAAGVNTGGEYQVEIINTETGNRDLFAEDARCPVWSADNSSIFYISTNNLNQVFQQPLDRSTPPELLFKIDSVRQIRIQNLASDGRFLPLYTDKEGTYVWDIGYYDMANNKVEMLEHYNSENDENRTAISPDGKWVAYVSNNSGQVAIYVAPFPGPGQPKRVTSGRIGNDIYFPVWDPEMKALYYTTTSPDYELWRINMHFSDNDFYFDPAIKSFFNGGSDYVNGNDVEIDPNGGRFLVIQLEEAGTEESIEPHIKVIVNWEQELTKK